MGKPIINSFDDGSSRRIAETVRRSEGTPYAPGVQAGGNGARGLQVRFGITVTGGETYPAADSTVFWWTPLERKPASLNLGDQEITNSPWDEGKRKGVAIGGRHLPVGTVCVAIKSGGYWWLEPIPLNECGYVPLKWADVDGWLTGSRQVLMHEPDECPAWVTVATCSS